MLKNYLTFRFKKNFRLTKRAFLYVLSEVEKDLPAANRSSGLPPAIKLAICLKFLAEGSYQHAVGRDFYLNVAQPTVSKTITEVLQSLEKRLCSKWIKFVMSDEEKHAAKQYFLQKSGIPGITMCIDGTHIKILKPGSAPHTFYNRKNFFSLNALTVNKNF